MGNKNSSGENSFPDELIGCIGVITVLNSILTVVFVGLRLSHSVEWPWLWVLSPLWIPAAVVLAAGVMILLVMLVIGLFAEMVS